MWQIRPGSSRKAKPLVIRCHESLHIFVYRQHRKSLHDCHASLDGIRVPLPAFEKNGLGDVQVEAVFSATPPVVRNLLVGGNNEIPTSGLSALL